MLKSENGTEFFLPEFTLEDENGKYAETTLPVGSFRMYESNPFVWVQQLKEGEKSVQQLIAEAFQNNEINK